MATETSARAELVQQDGLEERDYQAFSAALSASTRGRAFLVEYARRNRNADTELLLTAIDKLQTLVAVNKEPAKVESVRSQLYLLLDEIVVARGELDADLVTLKATKLADLMVLVEHRIGSIIASLPAEHKAEADSVPPLESDAQHEKPERTHLAVVPQPDQPELPIPSPIAPPQPAIALVRTEITMAEVTFVDSPPSEDPDQERHVIEMPPLEPTITASTVESANPLASIMALSEEERVALFS